MKILHLITDLRTAGAQMMLYRLLTRADRHSFQYQVMSLTDKGPVAEKIESLNIPVSHLGMKHGIPNPLGIMRLSRWLKRNPVDLIQTWMYHADLVGGLAARFAGRIPVVWGIHNTNLEPGKSKRTTIWTAKFCARLSRHLPVSIVCCSYATQKIHDELGYDRSRMRVIPNGIDLDVYHPVPEYRFDFRRELKIPEDTLLIGMMARFDPQKDHRNFVRAAERLHEYQPNVHFVLCGTGVAGENEELSRWIEQAGLRDRFHLLGPRQDIPRITAALDLATTSSAYGEAFPLVIGEAMASEVPCVVTDIGDSATVVSNTGKVVPPQNPEALAAGWNEILILSLNDRSRLGKQARERIKEHYSLPMIASCYEEHYQTVLLEATSPKTPREKTNP